MGPSVSVCRSRFSSESGSLHDRGSLLRNSGNLLSVLVLLFLFLLPMPFLGPAFPRLDTPLPLPSQVSSSRPQEDRDCTPGGHPKVNAPSPTRSTTEIFLFNPWGFTPALATRPGHPCASTTLIAILVHECPKDIVETHCCATMALDHISATMAYVCGVKNTFGIKCTPNSTPFNS
jgi:hypothetical protein